MPEPQLVAAKYMPQKRQRSYSALGRRKECRHFGSFDMRPLVTSQSLACPIRGTYMPPEHLTFFLWHLMQAAGFLLSEDIGDTAAESVQPSQFSASGSRLKKGMLQSVGPFLDGCCRLQAVKQRF